VIDRIRRFFHELDGRLGFGYAMWRWRYDRAAFEATFVGVPQRPATKISLVLPSYGISNADLSELVASVEHQTHKNWELCVCDDKDKFSVATDFWRALAKAKPDKYKLVVHETNSGISEATKSALRLATGDIVAFIDGDDLLHPRALEAVARRFGEDPGIDVVYTDHDLMSDFGQRFRPSRKPGFSPELMLVCNYMNHLIAVKRELANICSTAFQKENDGAQDWAFCFALLRQSNRISHIPLILYHWRARPESVASSGAAKPWAVMAAERVRREHWQTIIRRSP